MCLQARKELKLSGINSTTGLSGGSIIRPMEVGAVLLTYKFLSAHQHHPIVQSTHPGMLTAEVIKKFMQILVLSHLTRVEYGMQLASIMQVVKRHTHPVLHLQI